MNTYCHVFELMTRNPYCASPQTPVSQLVRRLVELKATAAPVIDESEELVGLVSLVDVAVSPEAGCVREIMQLRVHSVEHSASLSSAAQMMREHRVHRLVVTEGRRVVGVLSCLDLLPALGEKFGYFSNL
ncbi:CBS domain-containing protein [bacterium]|nr:CBS domain-containing protein [bacterium]